MPDTNTQQQNNNGDTTTNNSGAADFYVTADGGSESEVAPVAKALEAAGCTVQTGQTGPNAEALRNQGTVKPPTKLVYICNGGQAGQTYASFAQNYTEGMAFTVFAFDNYHTHYDTTTEEALKTKPLVSEHDSGGFATDSGAKDIEGHTTCTYQQKYPHIFAFIADETSAESLGQRIAQGQYTCGAGDATGGGSSGGGAQIKDKTFEKCMRRICAATDSIFLVENNAAVLFPYTDWMAFTLREKINTIKKNEIDPNVFSLEYGNDGFYNKVSIAWGGGTLPTRFPDSVKDKKDIVEDKRKHVNYTIDDIVDNMSQNNFKVTNINQKIAKNKKQEAKTSSKNKKENTTQEISVDENGVTILSEQYDKFVDIYGEQEKRVQSSAPDLETAQYIVNALLIQYIRDYNHTCKCRALNNRKYIGGTFYAVQNPFDDSVEMFYLNSYTMRTQKNEPMYYDLEFKYGPEGAEEILDYQTLSGGAAASSGATTGGSATEQEIWQHASNFCHFWSCPDLQESESETQDPQVAENYVNKKEQQGVTKIGFSCYGMSSWLYYQFNYKAGIPCQVVGNSGHHVVMIDRGQGMVETRKEYQQLDKGFRWSDQGTNVLLAAPNSSTSSGGNTAPRNDNGGNSQ